MCAGTDPGAVLRPAAHSCVLDIPLANIYTGLLHKNWRKSKPLHDLEETCTLEAL